MSDSPMASSQRGANSQRGENFVESLSAYSRFHRAQHWSGTFGEFLRTIVPGKDVVYDELPANADCTLTETDNGGANTATLLYNGAPVIGSTFTLTPGDSKLVLTNVFMLALTGFDSLTLIMGGGVLLFGGVAFVAYGELRRRRRA